MTTKIKDSGTRERMETGSQRDTQKGKPRPELIPPSTIIKLAIHYGNGACKYEKDNWKKGQPISRFTASAERHFLAWKCGMTDEPHLIAAIWNLFCIDWTLDAIKVGELPEELDDRPLDQQPDSEFGLNMYAIIANNMEAMKDE